MKNDTPVAQSDESMVEKAKNIHKMGTSRDGSGVANMIYNHIPGKQFIHSSLVTQTKSSDLQVSILFVAFT